MRPSAAGVLVVPTPQDPRRYAGMRRGVQKFEHSILLYTILYYILRGIKGFEFGALCEVCIALHGFWGFRMSDVGIT